MKDVKNRTLLVISMLVVSGLLVAVLPSHAYRMIQNNSTGRVTAGAAVSCNDPGGFTHWDDGDITWRLNTSGQGSDKATAIQNAMASWTNVPNAGHTLTYGGITKSGWATDGRNTIVFAVGNDCTGNCLALTALVLQSGQVIVESDITFNANYTWRTNGSDYDTEAVAAHEFGHTLGIHHTEVSSTPRPTMYAYYFGTDERSLESDDRSALQCSESKYPTTPPAPLEATLNCWGNYSGSMQVTCQAVTTGGCGGNSYNWSYSGTASSWSSGGAYAYAYYNYPGCGSGHVNFFWVTVTDSCGSSDFASMGSLPCW